MNPYTIIFAAVVIIAAGYIALTYKKSNYKVVETRDFSCPGMTGFTFKYPVFEGWEPMKGSGEEDGLPEAPLQSEFECIILLQSPKEYDLPTGSIAPQIKVTKDQPRVATIKNPHGILYENFGADDYYFNLAGFSIDIKLISVGERYGFSKDVLWKQVMESFKLTQ